MDINAFVHAIKVYGTSNDTETTMQTSKFAALSAVLAFAILGAAACSEQRQSAQAALETATNAVNAALTPDADKYAPKEVTALQNNLAALKSTFDAKNDPAVITSASNVTEAAHELTQIASANKESEAKRLASEWSEFGESMPKLLGSVHAKIDELNREKHVPKNVNLSSARADLDEADKLWGKAKSAHDRGEAADALASSKQAKSKAEAAASDINLQQFAAK
jgi:hypothetical protein